ncbi:MAG: hypothetical protein ACXV3D_08595, partial [Halobacteriota archaeon]
VISKTDRSNKSVLSLFMYDRCVTFGSAKLATLPCWGAFKRYQRTKIRFQRCERLSGIIGHKASLSGVSAIRASEMTPEELKFFRERYAYIPARLVRVSDGGEVKLPWKTLHLKMSVPENWNPESADAKSHYSSVALDEFHQALLLNDNEEDILHGLLCVRLWVSNRFDSHQSKERFRDIEPKPTEPSEPKTSVATYLDMTMIPHPQSTRWRIKWLFSNP